MALAVAPVLAGESEYDWAWSPTVEEDALGDADDTAGITPEHDCEVAMTTLNLEAGTVTLEGLLCDEPRFFIGNEDVFVPLTATTLASDKAVLSLGGIAFEPDETRRVYVDCRTEGANGPAKRLCHIDITRAPGLTGYEIRSTSFSGSSRTAVCPAGKIAISGGCDARWNNDTAQFDESRRCQIRDIPVGGSPATGWQCRILSTAGFFTPACTSGSQVRAYAICIDDPS
jgi:hypothetical protein